ncbi:VOC family protein [Kiritimatiellota bacterium B12222]|nr:VOC family protein [Kiritimatiellota bacterium B12222]
MSSSLLSGFHHTAIRVVDYDRSLKFYHDLGMVTARSWGEAPKRAAMLNAGDGNYVELFEGGDADAPSEARMIHFALRTPDCDAVHALALSLGATEKIAPKDVEIPSHQGPLPVRLSFVTAPGGEIIEFFQNDLS